MHLRSPELIHLASPHFPHPLKTHFLRVVQMYAHLPHPSPGPRSKCLHFQFSTLSSTLCCQAYSIGLVCGCPWQCNKVDRALPSSWCHTRSWCCLSSSQTGSITTTPGLFFPPSPRRNSLVLCPCLSAFCPFLGAGIEMANGVMCYPSNQHRYLLAVALTQVNSEGKKKRMLSIVLGSAHLLGSCR